MSIELPGLNVQTPWAEMLTKGEKQVETRKYPIPPHYVERLIAIVETPGKHGGTARIVGAVKFGPSFRYRSKQHFISDYSRHLVHKEDLLFGWDGNTKWGWPIEEHWHFVASCSSSLRRGIRYTKKISIPGSALCGLEIPTAV